MPSRRTATSGSSIINPGESPRGLKVSCHLPTEELHSAYMGEERRRAPRFSAHIKASINLPGENDLLAVMVEDLSTLGCLLESAPSLEINQDCNFALSWKGREFRCDGVVVRRSDLGQVGLDFRNILPEIQPMLGEICAELLRGPLVRLSRNHNSLA